MSKNHKSPKLLFIRGGAVGDFILTLPAINLVRQNLPKLEIEILGYPSISELAVTAGLADRIKSIESATMAPFFAPGAKLDPEMCEYFSSFDVVISYLYDPDGFFRGNLEQAGVETLITGPFKLTEESPEIAAAEQLAEPLGQLALFLDQPYLEVSYRGELSDPTIDRPLIAIHPGSGSPLKNWSFEGWANLAHKIHQQFPESLFQIISGEAESEKIGDFLNLLDERNLSYQHSNQAALSDVGRLLQTCSLFLGHDSGISHLAASTGIPGLILFGPSNPKVWAPQHPGFDFIQAPGNQLGNLTWEKIWANPLFQSKLDFIS